MKCFFRCVCQEGFVGDRHNVCADLIKCAENSFAVDAGSGFFSCVCLEGFVVDGDNFCADLDECADASTNLCEAPATCENALGSFLCHYPAIGYTPDGDHACADIDECATNNGGSVVYAGW